MWQLKALTSWNFKRYPIFKLKYEPKCNKTKVFALPEMNYKSRDYLEDESCNKRIFGVKKNVFWHLVSAIAMTNILSFLKGAASPTCYGRVSK